jgi:hypothetical protein
VQHDAERERMKEGHGIKIKEGGGLLVDGTPAWRELNTTASEMEGRREVRKEVKGAFRMTTRLSLKLSY